MEGRGALSSALVKALRSGRAPVNAPAAALRADPWGEDLQLPSTSCTSCTTGVSTASPTTSNGTRTCSGRAKPWRPDSSTRCASRRPRERRGAQPLAVVRGEPAGGIRPHRYDPGRVDAAVHAVVAAFDVVEVHRVPGSGRLEEVPGVRPQDRSYGPFGTVLVVQSWLVGVGVVVFGGALVGRLLHDELLRRASPADRDG